MTLRDIMLDDLPARQDLDALQQALALIWQEEGHVSRRAIWSKLYDAAAATPLFANDGTREALVLKYLAGKGIAPDFVGFLDSALGASVLYRHVDGIPWSGAVEGVAQLIARLHQITPPEELPETVTSPVSLIAETQAMARAIGLDLPPPPDITTDLPQPTRRFLHGDVVPGNVVVMADGLRLIDWQCPSIGDPAADLAIFLSPAMQILYGNQPLSSEEQSDFLSAYLAAGGDAVGVARYTALAPLFHWRMACYCHWKAAHGDAAYRDVAALERRASEQG